MAGNKRAVGSVTYQDAEHGYFERRKLRRHAASFREEVFHERISGLVDRALAAA